METEKKGKYYDERKKQVWEVYVYSAKRFDAIILTLASACLFVSIRAIEYTIEHNNVDYFSGQVICFFAGTFFIASIISNLESQSQSLKANSKDLILSEKNGELLNLSDCDFRRINLIAEIDQLESDASKYDEYVTLLNATSKYTLYFGMMLLLSFFAMLIWKKQFIYFFLEVGLRHVFQQ